MNGHVKNKILLIGLGLLLSSCTALPKKPVQADYDFYFNSMEIRERPIFWVHKIHGKKLPHEAPLADVMKTCIHDAYANKSVTLGSHVITDPSVLRQMENDEMYYTMEKFIKFQQGSVFDLVLKMGMSGAKQGVPLKEFEAVRRRIFTDADVNTTLKVLNDAIGKEKKCVEGKGWLSASDAAKEPT